MILDHDETRLRNFEPALTARRHENSEVHHGRFGPVPEALRDRPLVRDIDRVILAELRRSGGADQAVLHAVIGEPGQRLLDPRLFEVIELLARHVHRCYLNSRIQGLQQGVFELAVAIECHHLFLQFAFLVDPQGSDEQGVLLNGLRWHGLSPSMNGLLLATGSSRRPPAGLPSLCLLPKRVPWGTRFVPGSRLSRAGLLLTTSQHCRLRNRRMPSFISAPDSRRGLPLRYRGRLSGPERDIRHHRQHKQGEQWRPLARAPLFSNERQKPDRRQFQTHEARHVNPVPVTCCRQVRRVDRNVECFENQRQNREIVESRDHQESKLPRPSPDLLPVDEHDWLLAVTHCFLLSPGQLGTNLLNRARKESASRMLLTSLARRVVWPALARSIRPAHSWIQAPGSFHRPRLSMKPVPAPRSAPHVARAAPNRDPVPPVSPLLCESAARLSRGPQQLAIRRRRSNFALSSAIRATLPFRWASHARTLASCRLPSREKTASLRATRCERGLYYSSQCRLAVFRSSYLAHHRLPVPS